jgi:hypothetical protein
VVYVCVWRCVCIGTLSMEVCMGEGVWCGTLSMEVVRSLGWDSVLGMEVCGVCVVCVWVGCMCVYECMGVCMCRVWVYGCMSVCMCMGVWV